MSKITLVGAGSHTFARRLLTDIMTWPSLQDATLALMDIDQQKADDMATFTRKMVAQQGVGAKVEAHTDLKAALAGADYVIVSIRVGDTRSNVDIPRKYGIDQAVGDTSGPGGVFYFMRNAPAMIEIAKTMEQVCPKALMLNYTNPMVMLSWAIALMSNIRYVGLCHSVQGTAMRLAEYIGVPFEDVSYWVAGINHMAWFLTYEVKGQDAYPQLWEAMAKPDVYNRDIVKWEIMKHFGAFVSESSIHMSEYTPYFRRTPELLDRHMSESMWGVSVKGESGEARAARNRERREAQDKEMHDLTYGDAPIPVVRSHEFCTRILNTHETGEPYCFSGNVWNTGLITNLVPKSVVEVPIMVDKLGLHPCYVGDLPPALAALNRTSQAVQELAVKGFVEQDRESIYRAVQLDPLTSSLLSLDECRAMVDEMFAADAAYHRF
jgi:alpha-galactosidase